jgi:hypothetical protein
MKPYVGLNCEFILGEKLGSRAAVVGGIHDADTGVVHLHVFGSVLGEEPALRIERDVYPSDGKSRGWRAMESAGEKPTVRVKTIKP